MPWCEEWRRCHGKGSRGEVWVVVDDEKGFKEGTPGESAKTDIELGQIDSENQTK